MQASSSALRTGRQRCLGPVPAFDVLQSEFALVFPKVFQPVSNFLDLDRGQIVMNERE